MAKFTINILGCGSATPTTKHLATSQIIDIRDKLYMIDCGEGAQVQMRRMRIKFSRLNHIFISHLHGDHCFGLPGLISTLGMLGRLSDLHIYAPVAFKTYLDVILDVFCERIPYKVIFHPIDTTKYGLIMEDRSLSVYSIPLKHRLPCSGFLFVEKPTARHLLKDMIDFYKIPIAQLHLIRDGADFIKEDGEVIPNNRITRAPDPSYSYAYCSDTIPVPTIVPYIKNVDLLYHEATFAESEVHRAMETFHSTASQAAMIAQKAEVKRLLIGHFSARYDDENQLLAEAKDVFPQTQLAYEGLRINLK